MMSKSSYFYPSPPRLKLPLDLVENIVDQSALPCLWPAESQYPSVAADFSPDRQPLFQRQQPTGAAGFGGGGVGLGVEGFAEGGGEGGPLGGQAGFAVFL